ncbi:hypothetical protein D4764_12G0011360 [Takifugu flavidus]|uniref:Uncharacterized protein n=1 Tax=Takifugu flavidus TaxID=433684 RepID=A0A5C6PF98_9TELE|nr:hypothetical protein D4764_12G0011360 [Takifugu flavidus]
MACSSLSILLMCLLSVDGQTGGAERIKLTFTPTTCTVHCFQRQCVNYCKQGNVTTLYSGEGGAGRPDGARHSGFRVCKCGREQHKWSLWSPAAPEEPQVDAVSNADTVTPPGSVTSLSFDLSSSPFEL